MPEMPMRAWGVPRTVASGAMAIVLTLVLADGVAAQPRGRGDGAPGPPPGGPGGPGPRMASPLDGLLTLHPDLPLPGLRLTDAQRDQVRAIMQGHRGEGRALLQRAESAAAGLQQATGSTVDEGAAAQHGQALGAAIAEAAVLRARIRLEVFAILTPEQQAEATRVLEERRDRRNRFRRPGGPRGGRTPQPPLPD